MEINHEAAKDGIAKEKLKEVLSAFNEIRTPLAKLQKAGKGEELYSQLATTWVLVPDKGVGWHIYDGKVGTIIFRKDLGDKLLELLKIMKLTLTKKNNARN